MMLTTITAMFSFMTRFRRIKIDREVSNKMPGEHGTLRMRTAIRTLKESFTPERQTLERMLDCAR